MKGRLGLRYNKCSQDKRLNNILKAKPKKEERTDCSELERRMRRMRVRQFEMNEMNPHLYLHSLKNKESVQKKKGGVRVRARAKVENYVMYYV